MKKLMAVLVLFSLFTVAYAETPITVNIDSVPVSFDTAPRIINGRTMVPVRAIFEALGAEVEWDGKTNTVTATKGISSISMTIGKKEIAVGESFMLMDSPAMISENRTLVPARFAAEVFENTVKWDPENRVVNISSSQKPRITYYKKHIGEGISFMYPADWLLDLSYPGTVFIDNQPTSYDELGLGMISVSSLELVNSSFSDTVSARYDYLLSDCGYNITEFGNTTLGGLRAAVFRYLDADGDFVLSYFIEGRQTAHYIEFITDRENAFADIFSSVLSSVTIN